MTIELSDPRELQNDWATDPLNPVNQQPKIARPAEPRIPHDIRQLLRYEPSKLRTWLRAMGVTEDEYQTAMRGLVFIALERVDQQRR